MTNPRTWPWILTFGAALTLAACKDKTPPAATAAPDAATTEPDAAAAPAVHAVVYQAEDRVDIKRGGGKWYPGVVVAKAGDGYRVHFDGTAKEFDETVTVDRLRTAAVAVAPKPEVTDAAPTSSGASAPKAPAKAEPKPVAKKKIVQPVGPGFGDDCTPEQIGLKSPCRCPDGRLSSRVCTPRSLTWSSCSCQKPAKRKPKVKPNKVFPCSSDNDCNAPYRCGFQGNCMML